MGFAYSSTDFSPPSKLSSLSCFFFADFLPLLFLSLASLCALFTPSANLLFSLAPSSSLLSFLLAFFSSALAFPAGFSTFAFPSSYFGLAKPLAASAPSSYGTWGNASLYKTSNTKFLAFESCISIISLKLYDSSTL